MSRIIHHTERDHAVLLALSLKVRLLGQRQLAEFLWNGDVANTRRRIRKFIERGLVERHVVLARPLPELIRPVVSWRPGQPDPDAGQVAFRLQSRWRYRKLRSTVVVLPTQKLVNHFGGQHKPIASAQLSHDLGVSEVWLWFFCNRPDLAKLWRSEDMVTDREPGETLADAVLVDESDRCLALIEFGGDYAADRVAAFHEDAVVRAVPYQIW